LGAFFFIAGVIITICSSYIFYKWGWKSLLLFIPSALVPFAIRGYEGGLMLFSLPLITGSAGGYCFRKSLGLDFFLPVSTIVFAVVFTADYYVLKKVHEYDMIEAGKNSMIQIMEETRSEMEKVFEEYKTPAQNREKLRADMETYISMMKDRKWIQFMRDMLPFAAFLYSLAVAGFSFFLMKKIFMKKQGESVKALEYFRLNDYFVFLLIAGWGAFMLLDKTLYPLISIIALNIALAASMLYIIQALGIIKFFLIKKGLRVIILPLTVITLMILGPNVLMFAMIILIGFGTLDMWGDYRKLNPETERKIKE
jgi:hypothetical protein